ncbi:MAG: ArnT family glycosyltransferase [Bacteroidales bacterium]
MKIKNIHIDILIVLIGGLMFLPFLGGVHLFDWDEINFAESAREMIKTGDYLTVQVNYQPFWEKPPLFIWMQVISMKLFGINEFAARFPNAICGILTLLVLFHAGITLKDRRFGIWWVITYAGSILPFFYFKSGIIDPWFNLFIFLGVFFYMLYTLPGKYLHKNSMIFFAGLFIGLGVLTKGPVALLVFILTGLVFSIFTRFRHFPRFSGILLFLIVFSLVGGLWFILQWLNGNADIIANFIEYQVRLFKTRDAGHGGFFFYHFVVLFLGVFPASVFALPSFYVRKNEGENDRRHHLWMLILFWTVLILFTIVKTKIVHYSSMAYFPLTYLAAISIYRMISGRLQLKSYVRILYVALGILYFLIPIGMQFFIAFKQEIINAGWIRDDFAVGNLQALPGWTGWEFLIGLFPLMGVLIFIFLKNKSLTRRLIAPFVTTILFIYSALLFLVPKIEKYTQHAAIEFYKGLQGKDVYVETLGFKSYAHLFYSRKYPPRNGQVPSREFMLNGDIEKPAYFVMKNIKAEKYLNEYPNLEKIKEKNGFVFAIRKPGEND